MGWTRVVRDAGVTDALQIEVGMLKRTHHCGELRRDHVDRPVTLCGWVHTRRDHGGLVFIDLRDRWGVTQVVFNPDDSQQFHEAGRSLRNEWVIAVEGTVTARPEGMLNPKMATGEVEVRVHAMEILGRSDTPPMEVRDDVDTGLDIRLKHRYLDLRRPAMQRNMRLRHRLIRTIRDYFDQREFVEVETPMLTRSTPEGARDYLVPSRVNPGHWYALPQSPQLFKQILMVAGYERYYQIARCFRDEDLRADRQPEFTQLDVEMSFVDEEDVLGLIEGLMAVLCRTLRDEDLPLPLPRLTYREAIDRYGTDKPDLRYDLEIVDVGDLAVQSEFRVFQSVVDAGGQVRGLCLKGGAPAYSRRDMDALTGFAVDQGAKGMTWFKVQESLASPAAKFFPEALQQQLRQRMGAEPGDLLCFIADQPPVVAGVLDALRRKLAREQNLADPGVFRFCWVTDFPLVEWSEDEQRWDSLHHPFTSPRIEDLDRLEAEPAAIRARAYDIVLNGTELGGGSIRIHQPEVQRRVFKLLGLDDAEAEQKFGFLLEALRYGAPPHGGIALGIDRMVMLFLGLGTIRDCIAFPKTQRAVCVMTDAPSPVSDRQLRELGLIE